MDKNDIYKNVLDYLKAIEAPHFQDCCDRMLCKIYPRDYTPVRAGGSNGDMKNDGYCYISRKFFAAHASRGEKAKKIKNKIKGDLEGCLKKQVGVKEFIYLTNDTLIGEIAKFVDDLRNKYPKVDIATWGPVIIAEKISHLNLEDVEFIIDRKLSGATKYIAIADSEKKDWGIIEEIFNHIAKNISVKKKTTKNISYDKITNLSDKIKINFKSEQYSRVEEMITVSWKRKEIVEEFIKAQMEEDEERILALKDKIQDDYCRIRKCSDTDDPIQDFLIFELLAKENLDNSKKTNPDYIANAKAIILYFFEFCDIGKKTNKESKVKKTLFDEEK